MSTEDQEPIKNSAAYRRQQRDATHAAFLEISGNEKANRERKTAELRKLREAAHKQD